ncbi:MAG: radical SAM protein [Alphaproteobacteria bacterium]|nr:radical SAM protein [Alphaproteobacteria bacterium]MCB9794796.1 radical SAM protein [Alphaproteobacteria bacterium]
MRWPANNEQLFKRILGGIPFVFRPMVRPKLREAAESQARGRNDTRVTEADLIIGLFEITPRQFKGECVQMVRELGVEVLKYMELRDIREQYSRSWQQFGQAFHPGNYHITLYVTDRCNETCDHCAVPLRQREDLPIEEWIRIMDDVEGTLRMQNRNGVYIYFGGEPTVRRDLPRLIEHAGDHGYFHALATNGLLFDDNYARMCVQNGMHHMFVSLDSTDPQKASAIRGVPKSASRAERAIKTGLDQGLFVIVNAVAMKQNIDELDEIKEMIEGWGAVAYFRAVIKTGSAAENWSKVGLTREEYKKFHDFKYRHAVRAVREGYAGTLPIFDIWDWTPFMDEPQSESERAALEWGVGCQACRTISGIDVNGDFLPCYYPTKLRLGNLQEQSFTHIMQSQMFADVRDRKKKKGKCGGCSSLSMCGGGCGVHAECETGDFFDSVPYCWNDEAPASQEVASAPMSPAPARR